MLHQRLLRSHTSGRLTPYYYHLKSQVDRRSAKEYLREYQKATNGDRCKIVTDILSMSDDQRNVFDALLNSEKKDIHDSEKDLLWLAMAYDEEEFLGHCTDTTMEYDTQWTVSRLISDCVGRYCNVGHGTVCSTYMKEEMINDSGLYYNPIPIDVTFVNRIRPDVSDTNTIYIFYTCEETNRVMYQTDTAEGIITGQCIWQCFHEETKTHTYGDNKKVFKTVHLRLVRRLYPYAKAEAHTYDPVAFTALMDGLDTIAPELPWLQSSE